MSSGRPVWPGQNPWADLLDVHGPKAGSSRDACVKTLGRVTWQCANGVGSIICALLTESINHGDGRVVLFGQHLLMNDQPVFFGTGGPVGDSRCVLRIGP